MDHDLDDSSDEEIIQGENDVLERPDLSIWRHACEAVAQHGTLGIELSGQRCRLDSSSLLGLLTNAAVQRRFEISGPEDRHEVFRGRHGRRFRLWSVEVRLDGTNCAEQMTRESGDR